MLEANRARLHPRTRRGRSGEEEDAQSCPCRFSALCELVEERHPVVGRNVGHDRETLTGQHVVGVDGWILPTPPFEQLCQGPWVARTLLRGACPCRSSLRPRTRALQRHTCRDGGRLTDSRASSGSWASACTPSSARSDGNAIELCPSAALTRPPRAARCFR